jgi:hypothetical protein
VTLEIGRRASVSSLGQLVTKPRRDDSDTLAAALLQLATGKLVTTPRRDDSDAAALLQLATVAR